MVQTEYKLTPIGHITTPFPDKFAIPRQASLCTHAYGEINFCEKINVEQALEGIEEFSHLWILFLFHKNLEKGFKYKIRPPRLGGNKKIGVFASRSSFRPNHIGMSLVKNLGVKNNKLEVSEVDLLNNTPILDIKPYLPYSDAKDDTKSGYATIIPGPTLDVTFSEQSLEQLKKYKFKDNSVKSLIIEVLSQDPRPAYKSIKQDSKIYYNKLYDLEIKWIVESKQVFVISITKLTHAKNE